MALQPRLFKGRLPIWEDRSFQERCKDSVKCVSSQISSLSFDNHRHLRSLGITRVAGSEAFSYILKIRRSQVSSPLFERYGLNTDTGTQEARGNMVQTNQQATESSTLRSELVNERRSNTTLRLTISTLDRQVRTFGPNFVESSQPQRSSSNPQLSSESYLLRYATRSMSYSWSTLS